MGDGENFTRCAPKPRIPSYQGSGGGGRMGEEVIKGRKSGDGNEG